MRNFRSIFLIVIAFILGLVVASILTGKRVNSVMKESQFISGKEIKKEDIQIDHEIQNLINLKTAQVRSAPLIEKIPVSGQIAQEAEKINSIAAPGAGVITEKTIQLGATVNKDIPLCRLKVTETDSTLDIQSPVSGVVIGDFLKVGDAVEKGTSIYTIADLSELWANFDIYEKDIAKVKVGQKIKVYSMAYPEKSFDGEISFISPRVDETSHTIKIRALIQNPVNELKLGMFLNGDIILEGKEYYLMVPTAAVQTLEGKTVVFIETASHQFEPREITIKIEENNSTAIASGLKEGDTVVVNGSFLLKSKLSSNELKDND